MWATQVTVGHGSERDWLELPRNNYLEGLTTVSKISLVIRATVCDKRIPRKTHSLCVCVIICLRIVLYLVVKVYFMLISTVLIVDYEPRGYYVDVLKQLSISGSRIEKELPITYFNLTQSGVRRLHMGKVSWQSHYISVIDTFVNLGESSLL